MTETRINGIYADMFIYVNDASPGTALGLVLL